MTYQSISSCAVRWAVILCTAVLFGSVSAVAQVKRISPADDDADEIHVYRMTVSPAPEARPALKYHFLTPAVDQIHANAAMFVYKSMVYEGPDLIDEIWKINQNDQLGNWLTMPLEELPQQEILGRVAWVSQKANWPALLESARCDHCDWGDLIQQEGAMTLLPQAQKMRGMALGLALKARLQIAQGKFDDAVESLRVGYALTRNLCRGDCVVQSLIGMTIQNILDEQTRTLMAAENSPNLYWALTELAAQPIDLRPTISYEIHFWQYTIHELDNLDRDAMTNGDSIKLADKIWDDRELLQGMQNKGGNKTMDHAQFLLQAMQSLPEARTYLLKHGYIPAKIDAMPPTQIVLLYRWKQYLEVCDNHISNGHYYLMPNHAERSNLAKTKSMQKSKKGLAFPSATLCLMLDPRSMLCFVRNVEPTCCGQLRRCECMPPNMVVGRNI